MEPDSEIQWQEEFEHKGYLLRTGTTTRVKDTKINIVILNDYEKNFEIHLAAWEIDYSMDGCISILSEIARSVEISEHRQAFLEKAPERKIAKRQQPEINLEYIKKILNNNNIEPGRVGNMGDIHYFLSEDKTEFYLAAKIGSITVNEPWQEHPGFTITIPQDANYGIRVGGMPYREIGVYYQDATSGKWKLGDLQKLPRELEAGLPETFSEAITSGFTNKQTVHFFKFHFLKTEWHESRLEIESFLEEVRSLRKDFNEGRVIAISN
jgi:hypothetical protein